MLFPLSFFKFFYLFIFKTKRWCTWTSIMKKKNPTTEIKKKLEACSRIFHHLHHIAEHIEPKNVFHLNRGGRKPNILVFPFIQASCIFFCIVHFPSHKHKYMKTKSNKYKTNKHTKICAGFFKHLLREVTAFSFLCVLSYERLSFPIPNSNSV